MTTATRPFDHTFEAYLPPPPLAGPIVVASDTSRHSDAAFPLAHALAEHTNANVCVVSAITAFAMPMYAFDGMPLPLETDGAVREGREGLIVAQRDRLVPPASAWPVTVRTGEPAREIVDFSRSMNARVIVVGRGRHAALQRALGGETVLRLLQLGDTPILAVESKLTTLPQRVVIGTDFSEFSLRAAQLVLPLIAPDAHVYLVHVSPPTSDGRLGKERAVAYRNQALHAFAQLHERLAHDGMHFEDVLVEGRPSEELIKVVQAREADLVVTATHGYGFLRRMILGSVAADLVRHAPCSVLCVPGSAHTLIAARERAIMPFLTHAFEMAILDTELNTFTERNAGRRCSIEVDHAQLGAQVLGHSLPLVGATFERGAGVVSLMFGAATFTGEHLTHAIPGVTAIELLCDREGQDQVLRLVHPRGQTLVQLE